MSKQKVEIKPGQVWREKRCPRSRNRREVRVIDIYNGTTTYVPGGKFSGRSKSSIFGTDTSW